MAIDLLLTEIMASLRLRFASLNLHYEAAWTESWSHRRCLHQHQTLIDAATCAVPHGAGWYVFAVECGSPRQLNDAEEEAVNKFRFGVNDAALSLRDFGTGQEAGEFVTALEDMAFLGADEALTVLNDEELDMAPEDAKPETASHAL